MIAPGGSVGLPLRIMPPPGRGGIGATYGGTPEAVYMRIIDDTIKRSRHLQSAAVLEQLKQKWIEKIHQRIATGQTQRRTTSAYPFQPATASHAAASAPPATVPTSLSTYVPATPGKLYVPKLLGVTPSASATTDSTEMGAAVRPPPASSMMTRSSPMAAGHAGAKRVKLSNQMSVAADNRQRHRTDDAVSAKTASSGFSFSLRPSSSVSQMTPVGADKNNDGSKGVPANSLPQQPTSSSSLSFLSPEWGGESASIPTPATEPVPAECVSAPSVKDSNEPDAMVNAIRRNNTAAECGALKEGVADKVGEGSSEEDEDEGWGDAEWQEAAPRPRIVAAIATAAGLGGGTVSSTTLEPSPYTIPCAVAGDVKGESVVGTGSWSPVDDESQAAGAVDARIREAFETETRIANEDDIGDSSEFDPHDPHGLMEGGSKPESEDFATMAFMPSPGSSSDLDAVSDLDDEEPPECNDLIVAQFESVQRPHARKAAQKGLWRIKLRHGILQIGGREVLFNTLSGEFTF